METTESLKIGLDIWKEIFTFVSETIRLFVVGKLVVSSGKADAKFQSSSA